MDRRPSTLAAIKAIMNKRKNITSENVSKRMKFFVSGNGNTIDMTRKGGEVVTDDDGVVLEKRIYNLQANSAIAQKNERNLAFLAAGVKAEKAGDVEGAKAAYSKWLNAIQISFSVPTSKTSLIAKLTDGVEIAASVQLITTDNGSLLTIDPNTIAVMEPEVAADTNVSVDSLLELIGMNEGTGDDDEDWGLEEEEDKEPAATVPAPKAKASKPRIKA